jgi:hypothetical protein
MVKYSFTGIVVSKKELPLFRGGVSMIYDILLD